MCTDKENPLARCTEVNVSVRSGVKGTRDKKLGIKGRPLASAKVSAGLPTVREETTGSQSKSK